MKPKFDAIDKKLISYLYHNYREPLTKIAKACKISRDQVEYRIKKLESSGIIKKFATIFNYELLGLKEFGVVWLNLDCTKEQKNQIREELRKSKNVLTYFDIVGKYDLGCDTLFKDKHEFNKWLEEFLANHKNQIKDFSIFQTTSGIFFPLKELDLSQAEKEFPISHSDKEIKIDDRDLRILRKLEQNGRIKIIDIAKSLNLSAESVLYRLRNLEKKKIVLGVRLVFDMEEAGYFFGILRLKIKNTDEKLKQNITRFCKEHKYINALSFGISEYNCMVQFFFSEEKPFRDSMKEFLFKFKEQIIKSDIILVENEGEIKTLPL